MGTYVNDGNAPPIPLILSVMDKGMPEATSPGPLLGLRFLAGKKNFQCKLQSLRIRSPGYHLPLVYGINFLGFSGGRKRKKREAQMSVSPGNQNPESSP